MKQTHLCAVAAVLAAIPSVFLITRHSAESPHPTLAAPAASSRPVTASTAPAGGHRCSAGCTHGAAGPKLVQRIANPPAVEWTRAEPGQQVALGFTLGDQDRGQLLSREALPDGRVATRIELASGHGLHIMSRGDEWEGRAISRDGSPGWKLRGDASEIVIEEAEHEALICSVVGENGIEHAGIPVPSQAAGGTPLEPQQAVIAPIRNSRPGANGVIYLDFDGETVTNTQWNSSYNNGNPIAALESGLDATQIERVWAGIAEDYRPFNVNVTTDRSVYDSYPTGRRAMLVFTPSYEWYTSSTNVGGVAYVDIFGSTFYDYPGWVFTGNLSYNGPHSHEAASHEAGHILGLRHDGTSSLGYYDGHGSGATSWGPIMGVAYNRSVSQWSKGEYSGANNTEDDLAIITKSYNGLGYVADDHAGTTVGATPVTESGSDGIDAAGMIEINTDVDLFSFQTSGGSVSLSADNGAVDPNLDIRMRLLDSAGNEILEANPTSSLDATLTTTLSAGLYFIEISGTGTGDPTTGYSDYASLGGYTLSGTAPRVLELAAEILSPSAPQVSLSQGTGLYLEGLTSGASPTWELVSAPAGGTADLASPGTNATPVTFSVPGTYLLRLSVSNGGETLSDEVEVSVEPAGSSPAFAAVAPGIDLGPDRTIYSDRTSLAPLVTDDGLPAPLGYEWQILSGDGQLSDPAVESPELVFASPSTTRLRLNVSDGDHRTFREVSLTAVFMPVTFITETSSAAITVSDSTSFAAAWKTQGFDDSGWSSGQLGAGFDATKGPETRRIFAPLLGDLDIETAMAGQYAGALLRVPFEVDDPAAILSLTLRLKFDDGFVAYLNGTEVARQNVPAGEPSWDSLAPVDRFDEDGLSAVNFAIDLASAPLTAGTNILAIHGMNESSETIRGNSGDTSFLLLPTLEGVITELPESPFLTAVSAVEDPLLRGAEDDADGDGRSNLYEHATGTDLASADPGYPLLGMVDPGTIGVTLPAVPAADVRYLLYMSETLGGDWLVVAQRDGDGAWQGTLPVATSPAADSRERIDFPTPSPTPSQCFFKLGFELLTP